MMINCKGFAFIVASFTCEVPPQPVADTFCQIYRPVYWHTKDTRKSKEGNDVNNRNYKKLCLGGKR